MWNALFMENIAFSASRKMTMTKTNTNTLPFKTFSAVWCDLLAWAVYAQSKWQFFPEPEEGTGGTGCCSLVPVKMAGNKN